MLEQPILPTPHLDAESRIDNRNGVISFDSVAVSGPSASWRPFHVFNATPDTSRRISSLSSKASSHESILEDQQEFFREMEQICTRSARKYWQNQAFHYKTNSNNSKRRRRDPEEEEGIALMEYVQRINHIQFECAQSYENNRDAVVAETLMRTMRLLAWAEQVRSLAVSGGREMSDDGIMRAVIGARDLVCWLLDDDGEAAFNQMWEGKFVYGGLVMSEDDLCCCSL
ncbi:MAG: hypothetical protein Q9212_000884 [Teloschistes hypoglaucus]